MRYSVIVNVIIELESLSKKWDRYVRAMPRGVLE